MLESLSDKILYTYYINRCIKCVCAVCIGGWCAHTASNRCARSLQYPRLFPFVPCSMYIGSIECVLYCSFPCAHTSTHIRTSSVFCTFDFLALPRNTGCSPLCLLECNIDACVHHPITAICTGPAERNLYRPPNAARLTSPALGIRAQVIPCSSWRIFAWAD